MIVYSIKDMEKLSGVKAHTIRTWEKRYNLLLPKRSVSNIRSYNDKDLNRLLNINLLVSNGYKVSKIAKFNQEEFEKTVSKFSSIPSTNSEIINALIIFTQNFDGFSLNQVFDKYITEIGLERTMVEIVFPFTDQLRFAWLTGNIQKSHESFALEIIKSKVIHHTHNLPENRESKVCIIHLPEGEKDSLSLFFVHYLLKKNKLRVINLGTAIQLQDLVLILKSITPAYVWGIFNNEVTSSFLQQYITVVVENNPNGKFLISGYQIKKYKLKTPSQVIVLDGLVEIKKIK